MHPTHHLSSTCWQSNGKMKGWHVHFNYNNQIRHPSSFKHELPPTIQHYHQFHDHLYTFDGVILYKDRILIQSSFQQAIPDVLHGAHNKGNFHDCKWRIHHFLPSHQASHHCITCKLLLMQPLGHISTVYTTLPVNDTLVQLCRLLPLQKGELPSSNRQILQLANHLTSMQRFYRAN